MRNMNECLNIFATDSYYKITRMCHIIWFGLRKKGEPSFRSCFECDFFLNCYAKSKWNSKIWIIILQCKWFKRTQAISTRLNSTNDTLWKICHSRFEIVFICLDQNYIGIQFDWIPFLVIKISANVQCSWFMSIENRLMKSNHHMFCQKL